MASICPHEIPAKYHETLIFPFMYNLFICGIFHGFYRSQETVIESLGIKQKLSPYQLLWQSIGVEKPVGKTSIRHAKHTFPPRGHTLSIIHYTFILFSCFFTFRAVIKNECISRLIFQQKFSHTPLLLWHYWYYSNLCSF